MWSNFIGKNSDVRQLSVYMYSTDTAENNLVTHKLKEISSRQTMSGECGGAVENVSVLVVRSFQIHVDW